MSASFRWLTRPVLHRLGSPSNRSRPWLFALELPRAELRATWPYPLARSGGGRARPRSSLFTRYLNLIAHVPEGHAAKPNSLDCTVTEVGVGKTDLPLTRL